MITNVKLKMLFFKILQTSSRTFSICLLRTCNVLKGYIEGCRGGGLGYTRHELQVNIEYVQGSHIANFKVKNVGKLEKKFLHH